ncbi:CLUMA_CG003039, isoform A [Clunio marinus]|uniref:CLUMA_CG003039, isoform A n=1 Tax=Clunio marinus TaxID=568069 RepID=A0A1J1HMI8_9DIPT|nr:CLUMA_CG003039, isoform A [Clunio marinus]
MIILLSFLPNTRTLDITNIIVPPFVDVRDVVMLSCSYNIGNQKLNSVKWYKSDKEFYRYSPLMSTKQNMIFNVEGVHVSSDHVCNDKFCTIHLDNLSNDTSGAYRCEVSGDAPEFKLSHETSNMTVVALPQHDPKIEGVEKNYYEGDFLFGNCTSDFSFPPPYLAWYINDQKADMALLQPFHESTIEAYGFKLHQRSLEIRFRIDKKINPFITDGKVHMKCVSQIPHIASQMRESNHIFYVSSWDELRNQKLINWKNSATFLKFESSKVLVILAIVVSHKFLTKKFMVNS